MSHRMDISARADRDMKDVLRWTLDRYGERQHDAYLELINLALNDIQTDPENPRALRRAGLHESLRCLHIARRGRQASHLFVYRLNRDGSIGVIRFLHDMMDVARHVPSRDRDVR